MGEVQKLESIRTEIRTVTKEIIRMAGRRFALARELEEVKSSLNMKIEDPQVERELRVESSKTCKEFNVEPTFCLRLVNLLIAESTRIQKEQRRRKGDAFNEN